ncbi:MAG: lysylphosphatidylglycerol synthase transmembrane domain-containing protein [Nitrospirota bacterium]|jgi:uncharacterized membrane protein YbhN (UPF0104 family)
MSSRKPSPGNLKKPALLILKISVSGGLLYVVLARAGLNNVVGLLTDINPWAFVFAVFTYIAAQFVSSIRWKLLLKDDFSLKRLFPLYLLGSFFSIFMPGLVGGDAMKIYYLYKETGKGSQSLASVFMDRYIGFCTLMALGMLAFPFGLGYFRGSWIEWVLPLIVLGFVSASLAIFGLRLFNRIRFLSDLYNYFHFYRRRGKVIVKTVLLSVVVQVAIIYAIYVLALGLGEHIPFLAMLIFVPIITTVSAFPISLAGIGLREASSVLLFGTIGVGPDTATAISFAWFLSTAAGGLTGLYEYLRVKEHGVQGP